jgi:hypothetical protein
MEGKGRANSGSHPQFAEQAAPSAPAPRERLLRVKRLPSFESARARVRAAGSVVRRTCLQIVGGGDEKPRAACRGSPGAAP